jgi:hypothetical protein
MPDRRRVLILTTTFYPDPSVGGVRMTQWARCLPEFGWDPIILTRHYGFSATPELFATHVHPAVTVEYFNSLSSSNPGENEEASAAGMKSSIKRRITQILGSGLVIPDVGIKFWRAARPRAMRAVKEHQPHLIVTTGPPHSNHDIGLWLQKETGLPWVADFRDPYVIDERFKPRTPFQFMNRAHRRWLEAIHTAASLTTHAIPIDGRFWRLALPATRDRVRIMTNACTPDLAEGKVTPDEAPSKTGRQSIRVIGQIGHDEALHLACAIGALVADGLDLELRLIGHEPSTLGRIRQVLPDRVVCMKGLRHDLALRQVVGADVLVNYLSPERAGHFLLSSKLFEYLATPHPVIEVNPTVPDRQLLRKLSDVVVLERPTLEELKDALRTALEMAPTGMSEERREFVRAHEWRGQVRVLAGWFDELAGRSVKPV